MKPDQVVVRLLSNIAVSPSVAQGTPVNVPLSSAKNVMRFEEARRPHRGRAQASE